MILRPLLRTDDIATWAGVTPARVPRLVAAGKLPRPIELTRKVEDWR